MNDKRYPNCVIFDLDGTLADINHRLHYIKESPKNWEQFFSHIPFDTPIDHIAELLHMYNKSTYDVVFVTGRPERTRKNTIAWLNAHGMYNGEPIYMRNDNDRSPDDQVKMYLLHALRDDGWEPTMVFDDRDRVVAMWRRQGIPCLQVAEGPH